MSAKQIATSTVIYLLDAVLSVLTVVGLLFLFAMLVAPVEPVAIIRGAP